MITLETKEERVLKTSVKVNPSMLVGERTGQEKIVCHFGK